MASFAEMVGASLGASKAGRLGIDQGADALAEQPGSVGTSVGGVTRSR